ncbi:unnamed protein product [Trichobilharzia regenti]|nr:unnamed protein product [Trichobilharzia regenti]
MQQNLIHQVNHAVRVKNVQKIKRRHHLHRNVNIVIENHELVSWTQMV